MRVSPFDRQLATPEEASVIMSDFNLGSLCQAGKSLESNIRNTVRQKSAIDRFRLLAHHVIPGAEGVCVQQYSVLD